jgi:putative transposase
MADQLTDGRRFRVLTIVDMFTRESLAVEVGPSLKGTDVVAVLNQIRAKRGVMGPRFFEPLGRLVSGKI